MHLKKYYKESIVLHLAIHNLYGHDLNMNEQFIPKL